MKLKLLLYSMSPFLVGYLFNYGMMKLNLYGNAILLFSILFSLYWFFVGYKSHSYLKSVRESVIYGNSFAIISLLLLLLQRMFLGRLIIGIVGIAPQMYFLPILGLAGFIQRNLLFFVSTHYLSATFVLACLLMIAIYYGGYNFASSKR